MVNRSRTWCCIFLVCAGFRPGDAEAPLRPEPRFTQDVLPILADHCFKCHGADAGARKAGLRLDTEAGAQAALRSGRVAVVPGDRDASRLLHRVMADDDSRMPPPDTGNPLSAQQIATLNDWIEAGAPWESHWAYRALEEASIPDVSDSMWPRNDIDSFVLARLDREGIQPSPEAARRTLIRRLHLDLTGLPPTIDEVRAYLDDDSPEAYERVVDRLLASPHFGEKWARWWLDLAGYADSDGYLSDFLRPWAWRYRQWVVDALNADMPFDQFTIEQLAGDLLPDAAISQHIATGFLRNTTSNREGGADLEEYRTQQAADRTKTLGTVWLATTLECAQCHDHKYDPIAQREFYQFYAFFNDADEVNIPAPLGDEQVRHEAAWPVYREARTQILASLAADLAALQAQWEEKLLWAAAHPGEGDYRWDRAWEVLGLVWGQGQGEGQLEGTRIVRKPIDDRSEDESVRLQDYFLENGSLVNEEQFKTLGIPDAVQRLQALKAQLPHVSRAPVMRQAREPRESTIHVRGDFRSPGEPVTQETPAVLHAFDPGEAPDRLDLARWIVDTDNPLTARVTVNRLWQELFGRGLVRTSDDFGVRGARPSHPELLDWLALRFIEDGGSMKATLKDMVMSSTYRQSSHARPDLQERDPQNELLARFTRSRLSAELVRDNALAASGLLNPAIGGPSVRPPQPASVTKEGFDNTWEADEGPDRYRRGLYTFIQRTSPFGQFVNFDLPDPNRSCTRRERSNTPLQALNLLNDETFFEAARALAERVCAECDGTVAERVNHAFELCLARLPSPAERERLMRLFEWQQNHQGDGTDDASGAVAEFAAHSPQADEAAWTIVCSVILNLDEFITKE